jgi:hypothetical protein
MTEWFDNAIVPIVTADASGVQAHITGCEVTATFTELSDP